MIDFTHHSYLGILQFIKDLGYEITGFHNAPRSGSYVILRHDIDFSLTKALEMAQLDHRAGVSSTFFVLLTSPYYNALSQQGVQCLREIIQLGHECGLHYDCTGFEALSADARIRRLDSWVHCLEDAVGIKVRTIAQHKPASSPIRQEFPSYIDAYSASFFKDIGYISDSRRVFRVPDVQDFFRRHSRSQLVIHPIWWHAQSITRDQTFQLLHHQIALQMEDLLKNEAGFIEEYLSKTSLK